MVGARSAQLETCLRLDKAFVQHWALIGFDPVGPLEISAGGLYALALDRPDGVARLAAAGPQVQAKVLVLEGRPNGRPGVAAAAGVLAPIGTGGLRPPDWDPFGYLAVTESLLTDERLLLHANGGVAKAAAASLTWGMAAQVRAVGGLHVLAEIFSGDSYAERPGAAVQMGARYAISNRVQVDATFATGLWGQPRLPMWGTLGLRLVSGQLW